MRKIKLIYIVSLQFCMCSIFTYGQVLDSIINPILVCKIPSYNFFGTQEEMTKFYYRIGYNKQDQDTNLIVPASFVYKDSNFYIPNIIKRQIVLCNSKGTVISNLSAPDSTFVGFINITPNGNIISNNYHDRYITEWEPESKKIIAKKRTSSAKIFQFNDTTYYINADTFLTPHANKRINLPENQWFIEAYSDAAYFKNTLYVLHFEGLRWKLEEIWNNKFHNTIFLDTFLDTYNAVNILYAEHNKIIGIFTSEDLGISKLFVVNTVTGKILNSQLISFPELPDSQFFGNYFFWPAGVVYYYNAINSELYALIEGNKYFYIFRIFIKR